jgi:hypothetical protein
MDEISHFALANETLLRDILGEAEREWNVMREKVMQAKTSRAEMEEIGKKPVMS